ncbi:hypothetical protein Tco_0408180 [Tanacetum coccineum]
MIDLRGGIASLMSLSILHPSPPVCREARTAHHPSGRLFTSAKCPRGTVKSFNGGGHTYDGITLGWIRREGIISTRAGDAGTHAALGCAHGKGRSMSDSGDGEKYGVRENRSKAGDD